MYDREMGLAGHTTPIRITSRIVLLLDRQYSQADEATRRPAHEEVRRTTRAAGMATTTARWTAELSKKGEGEEKRNAPEAWCMGKKRARAVVSQF